MTILAIETSCDETAIAVVEGEGTSTSLGVNNISDARFRVLGNALLSQVEVHKEYGGVFPALAKREHAKNLVPLLEAALEEAELLHEDTQEMPEDTRAKIAAILAREHGLGEQFFAFIAETEPPTIDAIAVTTGPGLEPALWVGVNFARALAVAWRKPLVAVNHMEGHILAALARSGEGGAFSIAGVRLPLLALLVSGGHTELVLMKKWLAYELVGRTRDDAVGEAFDKVARMLGLPYPGGPEISRLAEGERRSRPASMDIVSPYILPRPMTGSGDCDFSFAGLKTAVRYLLAGKPEPFEEEKARIAREFEDAAVEVLWKKTARALEDSRAQTLAIGGGVSANTHLRRVLREETAAQFPEVGLFIPPATLSTDNAVMIALAGFYRAQKKEFADPATLSASGNRSLA